MCSCVSHVNVKFVSSDQVNGAKFVSQVASVKFVSLQTKVASVNFVYKVRLLVATTLDDIADHEVIM